MKETAGLVTIVIPAYNAERFLQETLESVKVQSYDRLEIVVVNDGSRDNTKQLVLAEKDPRVRLIDQDNSGVSAARNHGLQSAAGEYIVFLDADDLLTPFFVEIRVQALEKEKNLGFAGGLVESFPVKSPLRKAVAKDPENEILFFKPGYSTVPSNYMFRKKILTDHQLLFNTRLSSTADRFFILQVSKHTQGIVLENETGKLLYRVSESSMSHQVNARLIYDNEQFYAELKKEGLLPALKQGKFKSLYFFSLGLGFAKIKHPGSFICYIWKSAMADPFYFSRLIGKRLFRNKKI